MPVILGNTGAKEDTPAWKNLLNAVANVAPKTGVAEKVPGAGDFVPGAFANENGRPHRAPVTDILAAFATDMSPTGKSVKEFPNILEKNGEAAPDRFKTRQRTSADFFAARNAA